MAQKFPMLFGVQRFMGGLGRPGRLLLCCEGSYRVEPLASSSKIFPFAVDTLFVKLWRWELGNADFLDEDSFVRFHS